MKKTKMLIRKESPSIPKSWYEAFGLMKKKKRQLEAHLTRVRGEWA